MSVDYVASQKAREAWLATLHAADEGAVKQTARAYKRAIEKVEKEAKKALKALDQANLTNDVKAAGYAAERLQVLNSRIRSIEEVLVSSYGEAGQTAALAVRDLAPVAYQNGLTYGYEQMRGLIGQIERVNKEFVEQSVAAMQQGTLAAEWIKDNTTAGVAAVRNSLSAGVAIGEGVDDLVARVPRALNVSRARATTFVRTEILNAARRGNLDSYAANGILQWRWNANWDACMLCATRHGQVFPVTKPLSSHPACRCSADPVYPSQANDPKISEAIFADRVPAATQVKVLGPTRFKNWKMGNIQFSQLTKEVTHPKYGPGLKARTLSEMGVEKIRPKPLGKLINEAKSEVKPPPQFTISFGADAKAAKAFIDAVPDPLPEPVAVRAPVKAESITQIDRVKAALDDFELESWVTDDVLEMALEQESAEEIIGIFRAMVQIPAIAKSKTIQGQDFTKWFGKYKIAKESLDSAGVPDLATGKNFSEAVEKVRFYFKGAEWNSSNWDDAYLIASAIREGDTFSGWMNSYRQTVMGIKDKFGLVNPNPIERLILDQLIDQDLKFNNALLPLRRLDDALDDPANMEAFQYWWETTGKVEITDAIEQFIEELGVTPNNWAKEINDLVAAKMRAIRSKYATTLAGKASADSVDDLLDSAAAELRSEIKSGAPDLATVDATADELVEKSKKKIHDMLGDIGGDTPEDIIEPIGGFKNYQKLVGYLYEDGVEKDRFLSVLEWLADESYEMGDLGRRQILRAVLDPVHGSKNLETMGNIVAQGMDPKFTPYSVLGDPDKIFKGWEVLYAADDVFDVYDMKYMNFLWEELHMNEWWGGGDDFLEWVVTQHGAKFKAAGKDIDELLAFVKIVKSEGEEFMSADDVAAKLIKYLGAGEESGDDALTTLMGMDDKVKEWLEKPALSGVKADIASDTLEWATKHDGIGYIDIDLVKLVSQFRAQKWQLHEYVEWFPDEKLTAEMVNTILPVFSKGAAKYKFKDMLMTPGPGRAKLAKVYKFFNEPNDLMGQEFLIALMNDGDAGAVFLKNVVMKPGGGGTNWEGAIKKAQEVMDNPDGQVTITILDTADNAQEMVWTPDPAPEKIPFARAYLLDDDDAKVFLEGMEGLSEEARNRVISAVHVYGIDIQRLEWDIIRKAAKVYDESSPATHLHNMRDLQNAVRRQRKLVMPRGNWSRELTEPAAWNDLADELTDLLRDAGAVPDWYVNNHAYVAVKYWMKKQRQIKKYQFKTLEKRFEKEVLEPLRKSQGKVVARPGDIYRRFTPEELEELKGAPSVLDELAAAAKRAAETTGESVEEMVERASASTFSSVDVKDAKRLGIVGELTDTGPLKGSSHGARMLKDDAGVEYIFKPASDQMIYEAEQAAALLAEKLQMNVPKMAKLQVNGVKGTVQQLVPKSESAGALLPFDVGLADGAMANQVVRHHIFDWLIGNHDTHAGNFLVGKSRTLWGVDKGQAWKFLGDGREVWDPNWTAPGNIGNKVYAQFWADVRAGKKTIDDWGFSFVDDIVRMPDEEFLAIVKPYFDIHPKGKEAMARALWRKREIKAQWTEFLRKNGGESGERALANVAKEAKDSLGQSFPVKGGRSYLNDEQLEWQQSVKSGKESVRSFTSSSTTYNMKTSRAIAQGKTPDDPSVVNLQKGLLRAPEVDEAVTTWRYVTPDSQHELADEIGLPFRLSCSADLREVEQYIGSIHQTDGFMSTSGRYGLTFKGRTAGRYLNVNNAVGEGLSAGDKEAIRNASTMMRITRPKGSRFQYIENATSVGGEYEVVMEYGMVMRLKRVVIAGGNEQQRAALLRHLWPDGEPYPDWIVLEANPMRDVAGEGMKSVNIVFDMEEIVPT